MKTYLYRASKLKSTIIFLASVIVEVNFWCPAKNRRFLRFIHNNIISLTSADGFFQSILKRSLHHLYN